MTTKSQFQQQINQSNIRVLPNCENVDIKTRAGHRATKESWDERGTHVVVAQVLQVVELRVQEPMTLPRIVLQTRDGRRTWRRAAAS